MTDAIPGVVHVRDRKVLHGSAVTLPGLTGSVRQDVYGVSSIAEYEAKESPEATCARDADKLECMIQGTESRDQGYANAQRWIDNSRGRIVTKAGQALADAVLDTGSLDWLRAALGERDSP